MDNNFPIETERKWILRNIPKNDPDKIYRIFQKYSSDGWRYRSQEEISFKNGTGKIEIEYFKTKKRPIGFASNIEEEYRISDFDFNNADKIKSISKLRHVYYQNGLKYEVDVFNDIHLIIMEVEIEEIDQIIEVPSFLGKEIIYEVTGIKEFNNTNLSK